MKHISKWTRIDYFKGLILLYFFSVICAIVLGYIIDGIELMIKAMGEVRVWFRLIIIAIIIEISIKRQMKKYLKKGIKSL